MSAAHSPARSTTRRGPAAGPLAIFAWPILFAALTVAGLILGLTGDGWRDAACWLLVGSAPLMIAAAPLIARRRDARTPSRHSNNRKTKR